MVEPYNSYLLTQERLPRSTIKWTKPTGEHYMTPSHHKRLQSCKCATYRCTERGICKYLFNIHYMPGTWNTQQVKQAALLSSRGLQAAGEARLKKKQTDNQTESQTRTNVLKKQGCHRIKMREAHKQEMDILETQRRMLQAGLQGAWNLGDEELADGSLLRLGAEPCTTHKPWHSLVLV